MKKRLKVKLVATCTPVGYLKTYQTKEEIELQKRRRDFFRFGGTAELYLFSLHIKKEIDDFKKAKVNIIN